MMSIQGWLAKAKAQRETYEKEAQAFQALSLGIAHKVLSDPSLVEGKYGIAASLSHQCAALAVDFERMAAAMAEKERKGHSVAEAREARRAGRFVHMSSPASVLDLAMVVSTAND